MIQAVQLLIQTVLDETSTSAARRAAAMSFLQAAGQGSAGEAEQVLRALGTCLNLPDLPRAALVTLVCGALAERGFDPAPISEPFLQRLRSLLESAGALADACQAQLRESPGEDPDEAFDAARRQVAPGLPEANAAWEALTQFWPPAIAMFSVSPQLRAAGRPLLSLAARIAPQHEAGHWLSFMLAVLDNEPLLVIEPDRQTGLLARMSGVADNFQLNVLLMDAFPLSGLFPRRRVTQNAVDVARGVGPQRTDEIVAGAWNLYTWQALQPDLKLPDPKGLAKGKNWIWNEGVPADIPVFEGRRVILLGPASYHRTWPAQRLFNKLPARLDCERLLAKAEVGDWLKRLAAALGTRP